MLKFWDVLFFWLHIIIILFNLTGWIWIRTRKVHLIVVSATIFSWLILGVKYGLGYCFLTDWHWNIKRQLGEADMPASFIKYFLDRYTPFRWPESVVDQLTAILFGVAMIITIYVNFIHTRVFPRHH
jgi:hypothetical protein